MAAPKKKTESKIKTKTLPRRIQAVLDAGLSPEEAAHRIGISIATLYRWRQTEPKRPMRALIQNLEALESELGLTAT